MKMLDAIACFGEACRKTTVSKEYDVTVKLNSPDKEPKVIVRVAGNDSYKALRLIASTVIVAGGAMIANRLQNRK